MKTNEHVHVTLLKSHPMSLRYVDWRAQRHKQLVFIDTHMGLLYQWLMALVPVDKVYSTYTSHVPAFERVLYGIKGRHGLGSKPRTLEITVGLVGFCQARCPAWRSSMHSVQSTDGNLYWPLPEKNHRPLSSAFLNPPTDSWERVSICFYAGCLTPLGLLWLQRRIVTIFISTTLSHKNCAFYTTSERFLGDRL